MSRNGLGRTRPWSTIRITPVRWTTDRRPVKPEGAGATKTEPGSPPTTRTSRSPGSAASAPVPAMSRHATLIEALMPKRGIRRFLGGRRAARRPAAEVRDQLLGVAQPLGHGLQQLPADHAV